MLKDEFITKIKESIEIDVPKKDLAVILDGMTNVIKNAVLAGDSVTIPEICKIYSKDVEARTGTVKLNGEERVWMKPAHKKGVVKELPGFKKIFE